MTDLYNLAQVFAGLLGLCVGSAQTEHVFICANNQSYFKKPAVFREALCGEFKFCFFHPENGGIMNRYPTLMTS